MPEEPGGLQGTYRVEWSDVASAEADAAYLFLSGRSPEAAARWYAGLLKAAGSLSVLPGCGTLAPEDALYAGHAVRQLVYGSGRGAYRLLFTVFEQDREVRILHVRHGAQQRLVGPAQEDGPS